MIQMFLYALLFVLTEHGDTKLLTASDHRLTVTFK